MYCTFYRPSKIDTKEFENIVGKLYYDLSLLEDNKYDEWSAYSYFYTLSHLAEPLAGNPAMRFLGLADLAHMPSDASVAYFYRPTYIATAFMMKAVLNYPSLMNEATFLDSDLNFTVDTVKETLAGCMLGCTGRNFDGAGVIRLIDCIRIFEDAGADEFLAKYPDLCPEFTRLYAEKKVLAHSHKLAPSEACSNHGQ